MKKLVFVFHTFPNAPKKRAYLRQILFVFVTLGDTKCEHNIVNISAHFFLLNVNTI